MQWGLPSECTQNPTVTYHPHVPCHSLLQATVVSHLSYFSGLATGLPVPPLIPFSLFLSMCGLRASLTTRARWWLTCSEPSKPHICLRAKASLGSGPCHLTGCISCSLCPPAMALDGARPNPCLRAFALAGLNVLPLEICWRLSFPLGLYSELTALGRSPSPSTYVRTLASLLMSSPLVGLPLANVLNTLLIYLVYHRPPLPT